MKVACYFNGKTAFGGAERRIGRVMNEVAKSGEDVEFVFTLFEPMEKVREAYIKAIGEPCYITFKGFSKGIEVCKYLISQKFDVTFYVGAYKDMLPFFFGAKIARSKTVLLQVSTGPSIGQFDSILQNVEFQLVAKNSDRIDCLYPSTTEAFRIKYRKQIVTTTPCPATDLEKYKPAKKEKQIAFISRWVKGKNVELFVQSILLIEDFLKENEYSVLLCGKSQDGAVEKSVSELIRNAKHPEIMEQPSYVDSEYILPKAEIFMSLQRINNYPSQSLLEAIACGCYIIASDEGDTSLLVKPEFGICCELVPDDIAKCIMDYINKGTVEKEKCIKKARSFAEDTFIMQNAVDHYKKMIEDC